MSGSNRTTNQAQHLSASCHRGPDIYTSAGRPLSLTDHNLVAASSAYDSANISSGLSTTENSSQFSPVLEPAHRYTGRPFNPLMNTIGSLACPNEYSNGPCVPVVDSSRRAQCCRRNQLTGKESHLNLECNMARNKEYALKCLRAEVVRGRKLSFGTEVEREQAPEQLPNVSGGKLARGQVRAGHKLDLDRLYNYNIQACCPAGRTGRHFDVDRDVTFRRLNLPTPKQQRATSCPAPVQCITSHSAIQRTPKVCPRPTQPPCADPTRSNSPSEARSYAVPTISKTKYPGTADTAVANPGTVATVPTSTTARANSPQQTQNSPTRQIPAYKSPNRSPDSTQAPLGERAQRQDSHNISQVTQDSGLQMDSAYGRTPPRGMTQYSFKTPGTPLNVTDQSTSTNLYQTNGSLGRSTLRTDSTLQQTTRGQERSMTLTDQSLLNRTQEVPSPPASPGQDPNNETYGDLQRLCRSMDQRRRSRPRQTQTPQISTTDETTHYYNASMFDEPTHYRRNPNVFPPNCCIDLTDETQYDCSVIDISDEDLPSGSAYRSHETSRRMNSCRLSAENICVDNSQQPDATGFDSTEYIEQPSSLSARPLWPPRIFAPCEQPRTTLLRSLAQKLSTTYDYISSLVATPRSTSAVLEQPAEQIPGQAWDAMDFDTTSAINAARSVDDIRDLRDLVTQCNFTREEPASTRECANAKRCGGVQFDSSDKQEVQDPHRRAIHKAQIENLVNDAYCPGIIQGTIDGCDNFNDHSLNISWALGPRSAAQSEDFMTLLEAFYKRIEEEKLQIKKNLKENSAPDNVIDAIHNYFANQNPSDLNRSIKSFLLSERLQDHEQGEKSKGTSLEAEVQKGINNWPGNAKLKLITYTGRTKPSENGTT